MRRLRSLAGLFGMAMSMTAALAAPVLAPLDFAAIDGWLDDAHHDALEAFRLSCAEILAEGRAFDRPPLYGGVRADWLPACAAAASATDARGFFEARFTALAVTDLKRPEGLFTGYFEPEARGSRVRSKDYPVPVYRKPDDLVALDAGAEQRLGLRYGRIVGDRALGYFTRAEIEDGAIAGRGLEIAWLTDPADAFFMQVQGSGRLRLPDGSLMRLAYAAKTGQPYTGIGGLLVERGILSRDDMSMQAIRAWMAKNPKAGRELMRENRSFVFFREVSLEDPKLGPPGAQKVSLTPLRSLAVDRGLWIFGMPAWLDTTAPSGPDRTMEIFRRLMIAQDTGTAIRGHARGDVFWGAGDRAALIAGHMRSPGRMIVLLPKALAARLLGPP